MRRYGSFVLLLVGMVLLCGSAAVAVPWCEVTDCHCEHWPAYIHPYVLEMRDCEQGYGTLGEVRCVWDEVECGSPASDWYPCWCSGSNKPPPEDCFLAGTMISMADGSTKAIEDVRATERVLAFDDISARMTPAVVQAVHPARVEDGHLVVNGTIRMTQGQPVLSGGRWVAAGELQVGERLTAGDGRPVPITSIQSVAGPVVVYNLDIGRIGSYVASGVIVHNKHMHYTLEPCFNCVP